MERLIYALLILTLTASTSAYALGGGAPQFITKHGTACCSILLPNDATPGEEFAAKELKDHIRQIAGVELRQIPESQYTASLGPCISIGRTSLSRKYVTDEQISALGDDGYKTFSKDGNAFFVGGRKRGSMHAVYQFLESIGVRWYSPEYTVIPKIADIRLPTKPIDYVPKLYYRDQWWNNGATNEWLARMRVNGSNGQDHRLPEAMGGSVVTMHGCHSYADLVPAGEIFAKHPDWFALREDGKRSPGELCLTNPELREFVARKVLAELKASPVQVDYFWVSQNDGGGPGCSCEKCTAERLAHGGKDAWSANTISLTNYVADAVKPEFPKVRIKTLAYNYTTTAPKNMTASDNVLVEICGNFGPGGDPHAKLVESWSEVARNISVYTYGGSNYGYWWPYPNVWDVGMQYPWALKCGVKAFYIQGAALGRGSGLVDLRAYVTARLAWDPSRNVEKEISDFCDGFYGPGGKYIAEYENWYSQYTKQRQMKVDSEWGDPEIWRRWVTKEAMDHSDALFQRALEATKSNPTYHKHVRQAYLEVLWGGVMVNTQPKTDLMSKELPLLPGTDRDSVLARAQLYGEIMRENGYNQILEGVLYDPNKYPH